jgi:hypothetical protein
MISKNKIRTPGYFIKRLRDNGFIVLRVFNRYGKHDPRRWTVLIDPGNSSLFVTCYTNKEHMDQIMFEINDGGQRFPKHFSLKTESIETMISLLLSRGVNNDVKTSIYLKKELNNTNEPERQQTGR